MEIGDPCHRVEAGHGQVGVKLNRAGTAVLTHTVLPGD